MLRLVNAKKSLYLGYLIVKRCQNKSQTCANYKKKIFPYYKFLASIEDYEKGHWPPSKLLINICSFWLHKHPNIGYGECLFACASRTDTKKRICPFFSTCTVLGSYYVHPSDLWAKEYCCRMMNIFDFIDYWLVQMAGRNPKKGNMIA